LRRPRIHSPRSASMTSDDNSAVIDSIPGTDSDNLAVPEAAPIGAPVVDMRRVLVFTLAGRARCCAIDEVREIVPITGTTRLPGAPHYVRGLINLRGSLVTVMDAALCLYGVPADDTVASILLVEYRGRMAGVIVDNVFDIQSLPAVELDDGSMLDLHAMVETALA
jgi:chemotaxis signal transduction protein